MLMPNLYGSIVSNAVAGICGGPGVTCGANIGQDSVIFEQVNINRNSCLIEYRQQDTLVVISQERASLTLLL